MKCRHCGKEIVPGDDFCVNCGTVLSNEERIKLAQNGETIKPAEYKFTLRKDAADKIEAESKSLVSDTKLPSDDATEKQPQDVYADTVDEQAEIVVVALEDLDEQIVAEAEGKAAYAADVQSTENAFSADDVKDFIDAGFAAENEQAQPQESVEDEVTAEAEISQQDDSAVAEEETAADDEIEEETEAEIAAEIEEAEEAEAEPSYDNAVEEVELTDDNAVEEAEITDDNTVEEAELSYADDTQEEDTTDAVSYQEAADSYNAETDSDEYAQEEAFEAELNEDFEDISSNSDDYEDDEEPITAEEILEESVEDFAEASENAEISENDFTAAGSDEAELAAEDYSQEETGDSYSSDIQEEAVNEVEAEKIEADSNDEPRNYELTEEIDDAYLEKKVKARHIGKTAAIAAAVVVVVAAGALGINELSKRSNNVTPGNDETTTAAVDVVGSGDESSLQQTENTTADITATTQPTTEATTPVTTEATTEATTETTTAATTETTTAATTETTTEVTTQATTETTTEEETYTGTVYVPPGEEAPAIIASGKETVVISASTAMHASPSSSSYRVKTLPASSVLLIKGYNSDKSWMYVYYNGSYIFGWVPASSVGASSVSNDENTAVSPTGYSNKSVKYVNTEELNVRSGPSTDYDKVASIAEAQEVTVEGYASGETWVYITGGGVKGWVMASYLSDTRPAD